MNAAPAVPMTAERKASHIDVPVAGSSHSDGEFDTALETSDRCRQMLETLNAVFNAESTAASLNRSPQPTA